MITTEALTQLFKRKAHFFLFYISLTLTNNTVSTLTSGDEQFGAPLDSSVWESWVSRVAPPLMTFEAITTTTHQERVSFLNCLMINWKLLTISDYNPRSTIKVRPWHKDDCGNKPQCSILCFFVVVVVVSLLNTSWLMSAFLTLKQMYLEWLWINVLAQGLLN